MSRPQCTVDRRPPRGSAAAARERAVSTSVCGRGEVANEGEASSRGESPLLVSREHRRMTAAQLAAAIYVTPAHIEAQMKGQPSVRLLHGPAKALDVDLDMLVGG